MDNKRLLIGEVKSLDLDKYNCLDILIMPLKHFSSDSLISFTKEEIINSIKNTNKEVVIKVDKLMSEEDINPLKDVLFDLSTYNVYFMFSDFAVLNILKDKYDLRKLIYCNSKMLASYEECKVYTDLGISIIPSTEVTLEELLKISSLDNVYLTSFGYLNIFYSKRMLLTLNEEHSRKLFRRNLKNNLYFMKEEKRDSLNPVIENENGTFIYTDFIYSLYKELDSLNPNGFIINSSFIDEDDYIRIISIFKDAIKNTPTISNYKELLDITNNNIGTGFLYINSNILDEGQSK